MVLNPDVEAMPLTANLKIALLENKDLNKARQWSSPDDQYSNRASSLTPSSIDFLETIGAWKHVDQNRVRPYDEMLVWDGANESRIRFDWTAEAERYNAPRRNIATMTENSNLTRGLLTRISELSQDEPSPLFPNTTVASIENGEDDSDGLNLSSWPVLSLSSPNSTPSRIAARLLIGADGVNSPVRQFAGIASKGWDYDRHGVVATLKLAPKEEPESPDSFFFSSSSSSPSSSPPGATAYQRFLPALGGPIALLPLPNNHASLVWSTTPANAAYLKTLPADSLVVLVNAAFRLSQTDIEYMFTLPATSSPPTSSPSSHEAELTWRLAHTPANPHAPPFITSLQPSTLASFPLRFRQSTTYTSPRIALAGDAAHTIHPLAGQGLNLGLGDARALADTIAYAVSHGMDIGDILSLDRYNRERWGEGVKVGGTVDLLGKVFGVQGSLAGWARGLGMRVLGSGGGVVGKGLRGWVMRQVD
jgi:ubiquinone biosynthesis monooxygenase Coq6